MMNGTLTGIALTPTGIALTPTGIALTTGRREAIPSREKGGYTQQGVVPPYTPSRYTPLYTSLGILPSPLYSGSDVSTVNGVQQRASGLKEEKQPG